MADTINLRTAAERYARIASSCLLIGVGALMAESGFYLFRAAHIPTPSEYAMLAKADNIRAQLAGQYTLGEISNKTVEKKESLEAALKEITSSPDYQRQRSEADDNMARADLNARSGMKAMGYTVFGMLLPWGFVDKKRRRSQKALDDEIQALRRPAA